MRIIWAVVPGVVVLAAVGCATHDEFAIGIPLPKEVRSEIHSIRTVVGLDPANDNNFVNPPYGGAGGQAGGMIGVLVETAILSGQESKRQSQERLMQPIREAALQFNFGSQYRAEFEAQIHRLAWLGPARVSREPSFQRDDVATLLPQVSEDALLVSDAFYRMEPDFSKVVLTTYVGLFPNTAGLERLAAKVTPEGSPPALYRNMFTYEYKYEGEYPGRDQAAAGWAEGEGAMVKRALEIGVTELVKLVMADLNGEAIRTSSP